MMLELGDLYAKPSCDLTAGSRFALATITKCVVSLATPRLFLVSLAGDVEYRIFHLSFS